MSDMSKEEIEHELAKVDAVFGGPPSHYKHAAPPVAVSEEPEAPERMKQIETLLEEEVSARTAYEEDGVSGSAHYLGLIMELAPPELHAALAPTEGLSLRGTLAKIGDLVQFQSHHQAVEIGELVLAAITSTPVHPLLVHPAEPKGAREPVPEYETVEYWKERYLEVRREQGEDEGLREALEKARKLCTSIGIEAVRWDDGLDKGAVERVCKYVAEVEQLITAALASQEQSTTLTGKLHQ